MGREVCMLVEIPGKSSLEDSRRNGSSTPEERMNFTSSSFFLLPVTNVTTTSDLAWERKCKVTIEEKERKLRAAGTSLHRSHIRKCCTGGKKEHKHREKQPLHTASHGIVVSSRDDLTPSG